MAESPILIGIDIGTTAVKGAAFSLDGECRTSKVYGYRPLEATEPGMVEQDPQSWMSGVGSILGEMDADLPNVECLAIGFTSQVNTHVFADAEGTPLIPAITWQDQRCAGSADEINARIDEPVRRALWDRNFQADASNLLSRAHWVQRHRPEVWEATRYIFSPKDFCLFQLTGVAAADALSSIGLVDERGAYVGPVINLVDGLAERLPPIGEVTEIIGRVGKRFPFSGVPANLGVMDAWASLYGSGAVHHGDAFQVAGTSEVIGVHSEHAFPAKGVVTFPPIPGWYLHAGPTQLGGDAATWLADFLELDMPRVFELAAGAKNLREPLLFLPHLMGERAPFWDAKAKGLLAGMTRQHDRCDLAYAVLEGVAFSARCLLERLEQAAGDAVDSILLSGGAAQSDLWSQIKADVMNRPLVRLANVDTGAFGAAVLAGVAQGQFSDEIEATRAAIHEDRTFEPRATQRARVDFLYDSYLEAYDAMKGISHRLHDFAQADKAAPEKPSSDSLQELDDVRHDRIGRPQR